jgi:pimeloyl-ACP methyl ester carboxylesterase
LIEKLSSQNYQVICIATRGHGKSDIGHTPNSFQQRADDVYKVVRSITKDSVTVLGFSDGGHVALKLSALHPEWVKKVIDIGAGDLPKLPAGEIRFEHYVGKKLMEEYPDFFKSRLALMPEPDRWQECLDMQNEMYDKDFVSTESFEKIKCPALIMGGDNDRYNPIESFVKCKTAIANAQLSIIPGCGHVVFFCNFPAVWAGIEPFLKN